MDYQSLLNTYKSIKTPRLKQIMQAWMSKTFQKTPTMSMQPAVASAGGSAGYGSIDTSGPQYGYDNSANTNDPNAPTTQYRHARPMRRSPRVKPTQV
jgi:hypothetical protein